MGVPLRAPTPDGPRGGAGAQAWESFQYFLAASWVKMQNGGGSEGSKPILAPR